MSVQLSPLPYDLDALEPMISKRTLEHHYLKHHQRYVDTTNKLIQGTPYDSLDLEDIIQESYLRGVRDREIFNQAAQVWNHNFYWSCMTPTSRPPSRAFDRVLVDSFGSLDNFYEQFIRTGTSLFGSGYVWLIKTSQGGLQLRPGGNAFTPIVEAQVPLLCADVWEHAYYLDTQQDRETYLKQFCLLIQWKFVESNYDQLLQPKLYSAPRRGNDRRLLQ